MENPVLELARLLFGDGVTLNLTQRENGMWNAAVELNGVEQAWGYAEKKEHACDAVVSKMTCAANEKIEMLSRAARRAHGVRWE